MRRAPTADVDSCIPCDDPRCDTCYVADLTAAEIERIFAITADLKAKYAQGLREPLLPGRVMALLFEKPSLRTRVSFEAAMAHLGGSSLFLGDDVGWGKRESDRRFRPRAQPVCRRDRRPREAARRPPSSWPSTADCPVINGLTD